MPLQGPLLPGQRPVMGKRETELGQAMHEQTEGLTAENGFDIFLHDNRSNSNHRRGEGTLFVPRDPFQVRTIAETGAFVKLDDERKVLVVGLQDPASKPEFAIDSLRTDDRHNLCVCCHDVLNYFCKYREEREKFDATDDRETASFHLPNAVIHHTNLFSLHAHATVGNCYICKIVVERIKWRWDIDTSEYEDYRLEMAFPQKTRKKEMGKDNLMFVMVRCDQKKYPVWNWSPLLRLSLWPEDKYGHHFEAFSYADLMRFQQGEGTSSDTDEPITRPSPHELAISWLTRCIANEAGNHLTCQRHNSGYLPTRLLDVRYALESSKLRIVYPKDDPAFLLTNKRYATLSHCWGLSGAAENPNLTEANLEIRKNDGLSCDSLPATFYDAIQVCSWLRISYLWIDSLCIIQDSRPDWIYEASVMHLTYQFGTVNISASGGADSQSGLFATRNHEALALQRFQAPRISRTWSVTNDEMFAWTIHAPAFSRAWIHRERQISPRILHFTPEGMVVWECCGTNGASFRSEALPGGAPFEDLWYGNTKYQTPTTLASSKKGSEATYAIWNDMCEKFSTKSLTDKSDMPIILSSLAEEFHKLLPDDEYLAGMWRNTLPQSLVWHTKRFWPEEDESKIAPSWSWLSAPAPIGVTFLKSIYMKERIVPLAKVLDVQIISEDGHEDNKYGPLKSGTLCLEGFLRKIWIDFDDDGKFKLSVVDTLVEGEEDDREKSRLRFVGRSWDEIYGDVCEIELDGPASSQEYCCWCMFTSIEEWVDSRDWRSQDRTIWAVLLDKLGDDEDDPWVRIGTIKMHDLIAFKMRYKYIRENEEKQKPEDIEQTVTGTQEAIIELHSEHEHDHDSSQHVYEKHNENDDRKIQTLKSRVASSNNESSHRIGETRSQDEESKEEQIDAVEAGNSQPPSGASSPLRTEDNTTLPDSSGAADPQYDSEHSYGTDTDTNVSTTSRSSKRTRRDIWTDLANIIKFDRHKVSQAEDAERDRKRKARKNSKTKSGLSPSSAVDDDQDETSTMNRDIAENILDSSDEDENIKTENNDQATTPEVIEEDAPTTTDTPRSTHPNIDSTSDRNSSDPSKSKDNADHKTTHDMFDDPSTSNAPPIHGFPDRGLSPMETLYQFDGVIREYHEKGDLKWMKRLNVRSITIV